MTKISRSFRPTPLLSAALAVASLTACSKLEIRTPADGALVSLPSATHVELPDGGHLSNLIVTIDGADVSNQIAYSPTSGLYAGDVTLAEGMHTIVARADIFCAYCSGRKSPASATKTFCVAGGSGLTNKTMFAQADNLGWSRTSAGVVVLGADAGIETKWTLTPKVMGTGGSVPGTIRSKSYPCSCLRSPNNDNGAVIELAACDVNDIRQGWDGTREQLVNGVAFFQFTNNAVGTFHGCLAEGNATDGMAGKLVQKDCTGASDRLWKARNNTLNSFEGGQDPWGQ